MVKELEDYDFASQVKVRRRQKWVRLLIGAVVVLILLLFSSYLIPLSNDKFVDPTTLAPAGGSFITVDGVRTFIQEAGRLDAEPVILIHGFGGGTFNWRFTLPALEQGGFHAYAFDLKGFDLSDKSNKEDYSHAAQAEFVAHVMDSIGISSASFVVHSMGANVLAHFAQKYPERINKIVIADGWFPADGGFWSTFAGVLRFPPLERWGRIVVRRIVTEERISGSMSKFYSDSSFVTPDLLSSYMAVTKISGWDRGLVRLISQNSHNHVDSPFSGIQAPMLVVWGANDAVVPVETGEQLHASLPDAEWTVFSNSGHLPMEERADAFNKRIIEFLQ
ncbi:MAG: alpha/beta hydrolase [Patescibacteria group bacterium]|nr:alpha/beta hydrolase [Patescibacteria group bacterium]MDD5715386.1 alpha/beta hydrolase [Patescibacteria group bacterium]